MALSTKDAWLTGPSDLATATVEDVPVKGEHVEVSGLSAAYSNQAQSEALEMKVLPNGDRVGTVNTAQMEILQFHHGVIEPKFTLEESRKIAERFGPAFRKVVDKIDELSGIDKEAIENAEARFPGVDPSPSPEAPEDEGTRGSANGSGGPDLPVRAGTGAGEVD